MSGPEPDATAQAASDTVRQRPGRLWRHANFLKLWSGQAVSDFGSEITLLALPLTAILVLHATVWQVGLLRAAASGPQLLFSIVAGVVADRARRRPMLIASDLARASALATIPLAALLGVLNIWLLFAVAFVAGTFDTLFVVTYQAFLPSVITTEDLVEGNSKLHTTSSVAQVAAPGTGGALVQLLTAPIAILLDALSFLFSAFMLSRIHVNESVVYKPHRQTPRQFLAEFAVGWRHLTANPLLRAIGAASTILGIFFGIQQTVFILYLVEVLHLSPLAIGSILAVGSIGAVLGAIGSGRIGQHSFGRTLIAAILVNTVGATMLGVASGDSAIPVLVVAQFLVGASFPLYFVNQTSLRQAVVPPEYLGRITAAFAMISWGMVPIGALIGGLLPALVSLQATLVIGGAGKLAAVVWLWLSPVRHVRQIPSAAYAIRSG